MTPPEAPADAPLLSGDAMRREEGEHVRALREQRDETESEQGFIGLAFSGGGIRSATFNLGILQALAKQNLLPQFDYLSTVSGGGYIGSWFSALIHRLGNIDRVRKALMTRQEKGEEAPPLRFLRRYSNYLTPKTGLSGDTLAAVATYLRNFGLNLIPLVALGAAFIFAMYLLAQGTAGVDSQFSGSGTLWLALALIMLAVWGAAAGLSTASGANPGSWAARPAWAWAILIPTGVAGILISLAMMHGETKDLSQDSMARLRRRRLWLGVGQRVRHLALARQPAGVDVPGLFQQADAVCHDAAGRCGRRFPARRRRRYGAQPARRRYRRHAAGVVDDGARLAAGNDRLLGAGSAAHRLAQPPPVARGARVVEPHRRSAADRRAGLAAGLCAHRTWRRSSPSGRQGWTIEAGGVWAALTAIGVWLAKSPMTGGIRDGSRNRVWLEVGARATPYLFLAGFAAGLSATVYALFVDNSCPACVFVAALEEKDLRLRLPGVPRNQIRRARLLRHCAGCVRQHGPL